jgi:Flp pilus assembly protein TadG
MRSHLGGVRHHFARARWRGGDRGMPFRSHSMWQDRSGAIAIWVAFAGTLLVGSAVLAVDYGRLAVLKSQLQNAADAAALGAAAQLDRQAGAKARAADVARNAALPESNIGVGGARLNVGTVEFSADGVTYSAEGATDPTDQTTAFVRVTMAQRTTDLLFQPVLNIISRVNAAGTADLGAQATATADPLVCNAPTVMLCDIAHPALGNLMSPAQAGRQLQLRERTGAVLPVVTFQVLCPPGTPGCSAAQATQFGGAADPNQCGGSEVSVVPASAAAVDQAVNARFGDAPYFDPAPNVIFYSRDPTVVGNAALSGAFGTSSWNPSTYWGARHGGAALPAPLAGATRYQVYLYESGEPFVRSGATGNITMYPVPDGYSGAGLVTPPGPNIPTNAGNPTDESVDGNPDGPGTPVADVRRRVVRGAVVTCPGANFAAPLNPSGRFIDLFITERSANSVIYAEIIGPVTTAAPEDYHRNVRLVE